ncbi:DinB family protein [Domibacillus indicus]|uniref:DinB family protein n=1 Tax=Domibacillus indicus TaxID=1437523 RepID=UPI00069857A6|nr:DinB family protein [Domibacillus indicus]
MESIKQFVFARNSAFHIINNAPQEKWAEMPGSSSNNIHWNAGHIFVLAEGLLCLRLERGRQTGREMCRQQRKLSMHFKSKWDALTEFCGELDQDADQPVTIGPLEMTTINAVLQFVTFHEGMHTGIIKSLTKKA